MAVTVIGEPCRNFSGRGAAEGDDSAGMTVSLPPMATPLDWVAAAAVALLPRTLPKMAARMTMAAATASITTYMRRLCFRAPQANCCSFRLAPVAPPQAPAVRRRHGSAMSFADAVFTSRRRRLLRCVFSCRCQHRHTASARDCSFLARVWLAVIVSSFTARWSVLKRWVVIHVYHRCPFAILPYGAEPCVQLRNKLIERLESLNS